MKIEYCYGCNLRIAPYEETRVWRSNEYHLSCYHKVHMPRKAKGDDGSVSTLHIEHRPAFK